MKQEELRIGNMVIAKSPEKKEWQQPVILNKGYFKQLIDGTIDVKPIPLTEEWLLKFGFERVKHRSGIQAAYKLKNLRLNMSNCGNFYRYKLPIDSVHQLQNLYFALTGIELTIN